MNKPSDAAMRLAQSAANSLGATAEADIPAIKAVALDIDDHTAAAIAEHQKVIEQAEIALRKLTDGCNELATQVIALQGGPYSEELSRNMLSCQPLGRKAIASIAALKTNEKANT